MLKNCQFDAAQMAPNTSRLNFASNTLEYNKLEASTILQVTNCKA